MPTDRTTPGPPFDDDKNDDDQPVGPDTPRQPSFRASPGTVGMVLFLVALLMLFGSSLLAFVWIRFWGTQRPEAGTIHLPSALWLSTLLVIGVSVALNRATRQIREGRHRAYRNSLTAALALAAGFLTVQAPALVTLLMQHRNSGVRIYGLIFVLILLHAMHVIGGMVSLVWVTVRAHRGAYERSGHDPIRNTTLYWHFLDGVWVVMFLTFLIMR
jgi:cytochrome c oxidase subunit 3